MVEGVKGMDEKKIVEPIKKETNVQDKHEVKDIKSKNKLIIIIVSLLIIGVGVFVYFKFLKHSNKQIVFYRYQNRLFLKNTPKVRKESYYKDIDASKLKEYTYQCKYDYCRAYSLEYQESGFDDSIDGTWVLIYDLNSKEEWPNERCARKKSEYVLYNVETKKKYNVPVEENMCINDVLIDNEGNPKGLVASKYGYTVSRYVLNLSGQMIFNTDDIIYGSTEPYQRVINVVNNGKKDLYLLAAKNYSNMLLYDQELNYINDIISAGDFDTNGNVIKIYSNTKTDKSYFKIFDLTGKLIYTSKMYDDVWTDNGYFIVNDNGKIRIVDNNEKNIIDIPGNVKKYTYTTEYNKYYGKKGIVSIMEIKNSDAEQLEGTLFTYNIAENKLDKRNIDFDNVSPRVALSRYFSNGYTKYKIKNTDVYLDNELADSKKNELKKMIDDLSKDNITKKLFEAKQNIYLFTEYDYGAFNYRAYEDSIYSPLCIPVNDNTSVGTIVKKIAVNYFSSNMKKLNNDSYKKIYSKYYNFLRDPNDNSYIYNEAYHESGLFGYIMASYFDKENKWDNANVDYQVSSFENKIQQNGKLDEFNKDVKKYIESYIIK